jgi:hypothetical protein
VLSNEVIKLIKFYYLFSLTLQPKAGYGLLGMSDQLVAETSTWQHTTHTTNIHTPGGIWNHDCSRQAAVDLHLGPRGHWERNYELNTHSNKVYSEHYLETTVSFWWSHKYWVWKTHSGSLLHANFYVKIHCGLINMCNENSEGDMTSHLPY